MAVTATGEQPPGQGRASRRQAGSAQPRQTPRGVGTRPSACSVTRRSLVPWEDQFWQSGRHRAGYEARVTTWPERRQLVQGEAGPRGPLREDPGGGGGGAAHGRLHECPRGFS